MGERSVLVTLTSGLSAWRTSRVEFFWTNQVKFYRPYWLANTFTNSFFLIFSLSGTRTVACKDTTTLPYATVRHSQCELLLSSDESASRCYQCARYRNTLRAIASRKRNQDSTHRTDLSSHTNFRYFTDGEKNERMRKQHCELRKTKLQRDRLNEKLEKLTQSQGNVILLSHLSPEILQRALL